MSVRQRSWDVIFLLLLILGAFLILIPLIWALLSSFKSTTNVFTFSFPKEWHFENYPFAFKSGNWIRYFANSAIMASAIAVFQTSLGAMAGFRILQPGS